MDREEVTGQVPAVVSVCQVRQCRSAFGSGWGVSLCNTLIFTLCQCAAPYKQYYCYFISRKGSSLSCCLMHTVTSRTRSVCLSSWHTALGGLKTLVTQLQEPTHGNLW